jgi:hypothetical protein
MDKDRFAEEFAFFGMLLAKVIPGSDPEAVRAEHRRYSRGQGNLVGLIIGVTISAIVGIGVGVPIMNEVIADANLSGTTALIAGFIPVMLTLMVFVSTAAPIMRRT